MAPGRMIRQGVFCWVREHRGHCVEGGREQNITTHMKDNQQKELVPAFGTTRTLSDKTSEEQTPSSAQRLISHEEMVRRVHAFFDNFSDVFNTAMKAYGMEAKIARILWHPSDLRLRKTLSAAQFVPEVKVGVKKEGNELPR